VKAAVLRMPRVLVRTKRGVSFAVFIAIYIQTVFTHMLRLVFEIGTRSYRIRKYLPNPDL
jgi:hypothetical protein